MFASPAAFLASLGSVTLIVSALCFFAYDISDYRDRVRQRLDSFMIGKRPVRPHGPEARLTMTALEGDQLELARRFSAWRVRAEMVPYLFARLRVLCAAILGGGLVLLGYLHGRTLGTPAFLALAALAGALVGASLPHLVIARLAKNRTRAVAGASPTPSSCLSSASRPASRWKRG